MNKKRNLLSILLSFNILLFFNTCSSSKSITKTHNRHLTELIDTTIFFNKKKYSSKENLIVIKSIYRQDSLILLSSQIDSDLFYLVLSFQKEDSLLGQFQYRDFNVIAFGDVSTKSIFGKLFDARNNENLIKSKEKLSTTQSDSNSTIPPFYHPLVFVHIIKDDKVIYRYLSRSYTFLE